MLVSWDGVRLHEGHKRALGVAGDYEGNYRLAMVDRARLGGDAGKPVYYHNKWVLRNKRLQISAVIKNGQAFSATMASLTVADGKPVLAESPPRTFELRRIKPTDVTPLMYAGNADPLKQWEGPTQSVFLKPGPAQYWRGVALCVEFPDLRHEQHHGEFLHEAFGWTGNLVDSPVAKFILDQSQDTCGFDLMTLYQQTTRDRHDESREDRRLDRLQYRWALMPKKSTEYSFEGPAHKHFIRDAIKAHRVWAAHSSGKFLSNVDFIVVFTPPSDKNPFKVSASLVDDVGFGRRDGINRAITMGKDLFKDFGGGWETLAHEFGHLLGLPDLYPSGGSWKNSLAGPWDLMSDSHRARAFLVWHRYKAGWLDRRRVFSPYGYPPGEIVRLYPPDAFSGTLMIVYHLETEFNPQNGVEEPTKVMVIERITPTRSAGDRPWRDGDVLVYTVDGTKTTGDSPIEVVYKHPRNPDDNFGNYYDSLLKFGESREIPYDVNSNLDPTNPRKDWRLRISVGPRPGGATAPVEITINIVRPESR